MSQTSAPNEQPTSGRECREQSAMKTNRLLRTAIGGLLANLGPMAVLSPYARAGYTDPIASVAGLLPFIEDTFGTPPQLVTDQPLESGGSR